MNLGPAIVLRALIEASLLSGLPIPSNDQPVAFSAHSAFGVNLEHGTYGVTNWYSDDPLVGAVAVSYRMKDDAFGYCVLVHELVHHLQYVDNMILMPFEANEVEAWAVTAKCFEINGRADLAPWARGRAWDYTLKIKSHSDAWKK